MEKFSVKKPFTVLVAVIAVIVLGFVSVTSMTTDLLPSISLPYLMVMTPYPGASPERVEAEVTGPLENALGTISRVKNVYSVSSENFSMVQLEFEDDTDMDSSMVKVSSALNQISSTLPDTAGTPSILELSMDMLATMYLGVERDGYDIFALSDYVRDELQPYFERQDGVASVTSVGLVEKTVQVDLNNEKINELNDRILAMTSEELDKARQQLDDAREALDAGQEMLEAQESSFGQTLSGGIFGALEGPAQEAAASLKSSVLDMASRLSVLSGTVSAYGQEMRTTLAGAVEDAQRAQAAAQEKVTAFAIVYAEAEAVYNNAVDAFNNAEEALRPELEAAMEDARAALQKASEDQDAAYEELAAAEARVEEALAASRDIIDTADLEGQITQMVTDLNNAAEGIDGSSLSALMSSVSRISSLVPQIRSLLTSVSAMNPGGTNTNMSSASVSVGSAVGGLTAILDQIPGLLSTIENAFAALTQGQLDAAVGFSTATGQISSAQSALAQAEAQYEAAREAALKNANADALLSASTLSGMIYAQNFSMPAGYIDDAEDNSWLLKIGEEYSTSDEIADILLVDMDGIGPVRIADIADVTVIDNSLDSFARLNGEAAVILSIYKGSASGTNEVSRNVNEAMKALMEDTPGLTVVPLVDQGEYITMIVRDLLSSMILGAGLAILILAIFLRTVRPTLIVGISIPLSVLFAVVLMYFSDLSLNIMTLSGLSLGIGMLVDNSIVVLENIFRLRGRGVPAPRAAVQGTRQVSGAIVASTLTTVCVFLPMVFTTGTVKELLVPMGLSITYCLTASLITAMTVVPASASTILRNMQPRENRFMERVQDVYEKTLRWCLKHKLVTVGAAIALLAFSIYRLLVMGIVVLPEMSADNVSVTIVTPEEDDRLTSYAKAEETMEAIMTIDGVDSVGVMGAGNALALVSSAAGSSGAYGTYTAYVQPSEGAWENDLEGLGKAIEESTKDIDATVTATSSGMGDLSSFTASGLSVNVYGKDMETIQSVADDLIEIIDGIEGFSEASSSQEETEPMLHLVIDKDKAMAAGFTVAQIYGQIAQRLTTSVTSTKITTGGVELDVVIKDTTRELTRENLMDMEFTQSSYGASMAGMSGASSGMMSGMTGSMGSGMSGGMSGGLSLSGGDMSSPASMFGMDTGDSEEEEDVIEPEEIEEEEETDKVYKLSDFATLVETKSVGSLRRQNLTRYLTVTAVTEQGYNTALLSRTLRDRLASYQAPQGYRIELEGETSQVDEMVTQMSKMLALALLFIYLVMVGQFQSLLSPFIVMFTIPLAFTGGMLALLLFHEQLSMLALMGFLVLMGTVVNNGIVFVDYANQLRIGGLERQDALCATGRTRMRPIFMTALTTILAMGQLIFGKGMGSQMGRGMAIVIAGGLIYATIMTLYIIPVMYDIFFKRQPLSVDVGDDIDDAPDDAAEYLEQMRQREK